MRKALMIVDDFYRDPHEVRRQALSLGYQKSSTLHAYPGALSKRRLPGIRNIAGRIARLWGVEIDWGKINPLNNTGMGEFRLMDWGSGPLIHAHETRYGALIYLNTPKQCRGGTVFYQHKDTGVASLDELKNKHVTERVLADETSLDKWRETQRVDMVFNRLIIFDTHRFHSWDNSLSGKKPREYRLTQNFDLT